MRKAQLMVRHSGRHLGFDYIQAVVTQFFGIRDIRLVKAEGLDIEGADVRALLGRQNETISFPGHLISNKAH